MLSQILEAPDTVSHEMVGSSRGVHESLLRDYQLLEWLRELMELGAPAPVILRLMLDVKRAWVHTQDLYRQIRDAEMKTLEWEAVANREFAEGVASVKKKARKPR